MTIISDMHHALDVAGVRVGGPRYVWRMGPPARVALEAAVKLTGSGDATRDHRGEIETMMGFPVVEALDIDGWELLRSR